MAYQAIVLAVIKVAMSAAEKAKEESKHKEILAAIEQAKREILDAIIDIRNSELKGLVRGQLHDFERFPHFDEADLSRFISSCNSIIGQIEQDVLDRDLKSDDELIPAYVTMVILTHLAMFHTEESSVRTIQRAIALCENFKRDCLDSVSIMWGHDNDLGRGAFNARSSLTGQKVSQAESREQAQNWALSGSSFNLASTFIKLANSNWPTKI